MKNGYCLIVRDYKAEIVEFTTLTIVAMPDGTKVYFVHTKFGDEYFNEKELSPTREAFIEDCERINKELQQQRSGVNERSIYKVRR